MGGLRAPLRLTARSVRARFKLEETPAGAQVVIATTDPTALVAIQQFLRFQIAEHKTGDSAGAH